MKIITLFNVFKVRECTSAQIFCKIREIFNLGISNNTIKARLHQLKHCDQHNKNEDTSHQIDMILNLGTYNVDQKAHKLKH